MKRIFLISLLFFLTGYCLAQEGTNFEDLTFKEALAKSKDSGKKLFIDCYTKTCGPCKYMVKFIFPLKECGDYFNSNYVCIMKDMEEGEGIDIAQKYNVRIYPTYLILNHDGTVYCRLDGGAVSSPKEDFVQKVKDAIELAEANRKYAAGERDKAFLEKYISILQTHDKKQLQSVMSETMIQLGVNKLCEPENWTLIKTEVNNVDTPLFRYLVENRAAFCKQLGQQEVENKIISVYSEEFRVLKMMGIDFALPLRYRMFFFYIINKEQKDRVNEILKVLQNMNKELPDEADRMSVLRELTGFERIANQQQIEKASTYLQEISNNLQPNNANYVQGLITHIKK